MKCLKCGNELKDEEIVCSNCGYNRYSTPNNDNQFATINMGVYNQHPIDKEKVEERLENQKQFSELVEIYIGNMYYNFRKGGFSFCAFLLGPLYFLYRKLYAVAGIIYLISFGITGFFSFTTQGRFNEIQDIRSLIAIKGFNTYLIIYLLIFLIFRLFLGLTFKKFYFNEVVERIGKIKQENPDLGFNELAEFAKKKGGTNIFAAIIAILAPVILTLIAIAISIFIIGIQLF